ncbi:hypothetical protein FB385_1064 [Paramicrobacterium agarici]|nr:hypothetical protein FB385_1064 [Microbacterium agarici]
MSSYSATYDERNSAADCLNQLIVASDRIGELLSRHKPSGEILASAPSSADQNVAARAVALHRAVAVDHLVSFAQLLSLRESPGPSLAALVRGCLETWGRAWWVMSATTRGQAEFRARAMVVNELSTAKKRGITLLSGESLDDAIDRATAERDSVSDAQPEAVPRYTSLACELLEQCGSSSTEAAAVYSHLSGVAHGESIFTESLSSRPGGGLDSLSTINLPSQNLSTYCTHLFGVTAISTSLLVRVWGLPAAAGDSFLNAVSETARCFETNRGFPPGRTGTDE